MQCPRCRGRSLDEQTLNGKRHRHAASPYRESGAPEESSALASEIWVSRCEQCRGVWLDDQELGRAMRSLKILRVPDLPADLSLNSIAPCSCPRCHIEMIVQRSSAVPAVVYDRCPQCRGIWLDAGELRCFANPLVALSAFVAHEFG